MRASRITIMLVHASGGAENMSIHGRQLQCDRHCLMGCVLFADCHEAQSEVRPRKRIIWKVVDMFAQVANVHAGTEVQFIEFSLRSSMVACFLTSGAAFESGLVSVLAAFSASPSIPSTIAVSTSSAAVITSLLLRHASSRAFNSSGIP